MAPEPPAGGFLDATAAEMERVLYSQMLILFAPHAVEPRTQLPLLLATLHRPQPPLRHAAAATLRHLAERDPQGVLPAHVERALLAAMDVETSGATVAQLQATLQVPMTMGVGVCRTGYAESHVQCVVCHVHSHCRRASSHTPTSYKPPQTLMLSGAPLDPLQWLATLAEVATALPPSTAPEAGRAAEEGEGDDDGEMLQRAAPPRAPASGEAGKASPRCCSPCRRTLR